MDNSLRKFISSRREKAEGVYTHISQIDPTGKFNISRKDTEEFWDIYCNLLFNNDKMVSGLGEYPNPFMPVLNDTDIKIPYIENKHNLNEKLYNENHTIETIRVYQKHLKSTIEDYKSSYGICFLFEKEKPTLDDKGNISHGFHLQFINTFMHKIDQDVHLIPRIRNEISDKQIFKEFYKNSIDAIDKSCTSKFWLLYGSRKRSTLQSYRLTKIYNDELNEITLEEALKDYILLDTHGDKIVFDKPLTYYLPRILSTHPENKEIVKVKLDLNIITKKYLKKAKESKRIIEDKPITESLKNAKELIKLIDPLRADDYTDWINLGWILYNIGDGTEEALEMWIDFSSKTSKKNNFSEKLCVYEWNRMEKKSYTIGSLHYLAKHDNPEEYKKINKKLNEKNINQSLDGGHYDLAELLYREYKDQFVCACIEKNVWFRYQNHRWHLDKKGISLEKKIPIELVGKYQERKKKIAQEIGEEEGGDEEAMLQKKLKSINKLIANLKSTPFLNNIMKCCQLLFYNEIFSEKLDNDPCLMHFNNGILDVREMKFREGRPTDYISLSTGYAYPVKYNEIEKTYEDIYNWDSLEVMEVEDHFSKVFPDPILKQYFMEYIANLLKGGNNIKTFLNMSGEGDNGKSINMDLLKETLGRYMKVLPTSLIVGKRGQSSQATPELSGIQGVRFAILQEPNSKDIINIGILKELSGNDIIYIRGLYKESQEVRPMFKLVLVCLSKDTKIGLSSCTSLSIDKLTNELNINKLLSWDEKQNGIINAERINYFNQGQQECIELTFMDNKKITCTPNHKFLTKNNKWIEAQHIKENNTEIKFGVDHVNVNDMFDDFNYKLDYRKGEYHINDRIKDAALCRLMGYLNDNDLKKGYINIPIVNYKSIIDDLNLVTNEDVIFSDIYDKYKKEYRISIPYSLQYIISSFSHNLYNKDCPLFLVREYIAGKFGRQGWVPYLSSDNFDSIGLIHITPDITLLLKERFNIEMYRNFFINEENELKFITEIGFRYNLVNSYRCTAKSSYYNYKKINNNFNLQDYITSTGLDKFWTEEFTSILPVYHLKLASIKNVGIQNVYDLTIENPYNSFIANGAITHNCNKLPKLPCDDPATWNRIRVLPYESCFPKDEKTVPENLEDQIKVKRFPRDPYFSEKIPKMNAPLIWMMFETYKRITKEGRMIEPEKVRDATLTYRKNNDVFLQFITEKIIKDPSNDKAYMSVVELYNSFKSWFNDSYPNLHGQIPSKEDMKDEIIRKWGELSSNHKWKGYRLRTQEDDELEGKIIILRENDLDSKNEKNEDKKDNKDENSDEENEENDTENETELETDVDFNMEEPIYTTKKVKKPVKVCNESSDDSDDDSDDDNISTAPM